jgi:GNAT superfamily N-acetyltransferase
MRYPSLSDLDAEQIKAIGAAKAQWSWLFQKGDITYLILKNWPAFAVSARDSSGTDVWYVNTSTQGQHYAIEVPPEFRWKWIGTLLLQTKEAMNGILSHDWSGRYSRIFFLIKRGFIPAGTVQKYEKISHDKAISPSEMDVLVSQLKQHVTKRLTWDSDADISPVVFRLKYSPGKARKFLKQNGLE